MTSPIVVSTVTLTNPHGAGSDFALYALDAFDGRLYGAGWLNGENSSPSNPDGTGLDRIYVSSSPTLDDFSRLQFTNGQSPGTWNDANGQTTLYDEVANSGTNTYSLTPYYSPSQPLGGSSNLYYQVNDPTVVAEGSNLVMFMTAVPCQNEYPATTTEPNGNPDFQVGWSGIGYAISSDSGATWTWEGTLPLLHADGTPLLAPVTQIFPTDPAVTYPLVAGGNSSPSAIFTDATGVDLWYTSLRDDGALTIDGTPVLTLSKEDRFGNWNTPQKCQLVTSSGTADFYVVNQDVQLADDGSGTLWMVAEQWGGPESGDIKLFYSGTADGANQGVDWHTWDGADGVLVVATNTAYAGLFDLITPAILSVGGGSLSIDYSVPTTITAGGIPENFSQISESFVLPCFAAGTRLLTCRGEVPVEELRMGDPMPTLTGPGLARVRWIGQRDVHSRAVRACANAFGVGRPGRDLRLSPDHAVHVDGVLIPVRYLLNGRTIVSEEPAWVAYWHVELERHAVLLAEGLPCESYLDTGNRAALAGTAAAA